MKRVVFVLFFTFVFFQTIDAQITFNKRIVIDSFPKVVTSIYPTDSCYYGIGIVSDSINLLAPGNIFYKFDLEGNLLFWKKRTQPFKTFGTWKKLKVNLEGDFFTFGSTQDTSLNLNRKGIFLKFNAEGDTILTKEFVSPNFNITGDPFYAILDFEVTPDSGYIFVGNTASSTKDIAVVKVDKAGNEVWAKTYGSTNQHNNAVNCIIADEENYIIGATNNTSGLGLNSSAYSLYMFSIDSLGNELWSYIAPIEDKLDSANDIIKLSDGSYIIASAMKTGITNNEFYYVGSIARLDSDLQTIWHKPVYNAPHSPINFLFGLVENENEEAFTGWGIQYGFDDTTYHFESWLAKVSADGDSLWSHSYTHLGFNSDYRHRLYDVRATVDGGYIMCGESIDFTPEGDGQKGWLIKVDENGCLVPGCTTNIEEIVNGEEYPIIKTYPNPTSDFLNIYFRNQNNKKDGRFKLVDLNGRVLFEFQADKKETTFILSLEKYSSGIYFLQYIQENSAIQTKQIIIQK